MIPNIGIDGAAEVVFLLMIQLAGLSTDFFSSSLTPYPSAAYTPRTDGTPSPPTL